MLAIKNSSESKCARGPFKEIVSRDWEGQQMVSLARFDV
jgi:hypothetical protein